MLNFEDTIRNELPTARYLILELAALLDRLDAASARDGKDAGSDARVMAMRSALSALANPQQSGDRAEQFLLNDSVA